MKKTQTVILEIAVDRSNEKGVFVAKEMLSTLHDTLRHQKKSWKFWKNNSPQFHFFLVHAGGRIRFFFEVEKIHQEFLESQLYAHYSNIEITEAELPFDEKTEFFTQNAGLSVISAELIKLYINLKDRTEKETIDPLSSLTSVLSKSEKNEISFFRVDFSPLSDKNFRENPAKEIIASKKYPNFWKIFLLSYS